MGIYPAGNQHNNELGRVFMDAYVLSIDQGTTGTTILIIDHEGRIVARAGREFKQYYPSPAGSNMTPGKSLKSPAC